MTSYQDRPRSRFFQIADKAVAGLTVLLLMGICFCWGAWTERSDARAAQMMQCPNTSQGE
jgi:hypothetical protein